MAKTEVSNRWLLNRMQLMAALDAGLGELCPLTVSAIRPTTGQGLGFVMQIEIPKHRVVEFSAVMEKMQ